MKMMRISENTLLFSYLDVDRRAGYLARHMFKFRTSQPNGIHCTVLMVYIYHD